MAEFYHFTPQSNSERRCFLSQVYRRPHSRINKTKMPAVTGVPRSILTKPLGKILQEADLVSSFQIESALQDKIQHPDLRIGDILAQRGLIKPETADFFVQDWSKIVMQPNKNALGWYLTQAAILNRAHIEVILTVQRTTGVRFGTVAVLQGFLKSTTLDFFLANLFPEELHVSPFINMYSQKN